MLLESISWLQCVMFRVTILLRFSLIMTVHPRMHLSLLHEFLELGDDTYVEAVLQCPSCRRTVCRTTDLCFFVRKPGCRGFGGAVYLILKPGIPRPSGIRQVSPKWENSIKSWECECQCYLGDTKRVYLDPAFVVASDVGGRLRFASRRSLPMITFNPTAVILCGHLHRGSDLFSWLPIYLMQRYRHIEVRDRERMLQFIEEGTIDASNPRPVNRSSLRLMRRCRILRWMKRKKNTKEKGLVIENCCLGRGRRRKNRRE